MAYTGAQKPLKSEKLDEAQALAKSCAGRPDFLPCDGLSICATHSHGKCFKLHWCCHLGWCHCKFPTSENKTFHSILNILSVTKYVQNTLKWWVVYIITLCCLSAINKMTVILLELLMSLFDINNKLWNILS